LTSQTSKSRHDPGEWRSRPDIRLDVWLAPDSDPDMRDEPGGSAAIKDWKPMRDRSTNSIGVEVEEPLFLDEPADYASNLTPRQQQSGIELFAEEAPPFPAAPPPLRFNMLVVSFVVVAVAAFLTVRACQITGASAFGLGQLLGR
jgi:hypothetical protein